MARDALVVTPTPDGTSVDVEYAASDAALDAWATASAERRRGNATTPSPVAPILVVTGFIARTPAGAVTTLRRNGSDYSATIVGALVGAAGITIWTDVDGVFSADPRKVPEAVSQRKDGRRGWMEGEREGGRQAYHHPVRRPAPPPPPTAG